jgi:hypothetical protein
MKTKIYLVSLLGFTLGVTLNAQNVSASAETTQSEQTASTANGNKRILSRLGGKTVPDNLSAETPLAVKTANISGESDRNELLKLAEALAYQSRRLRNEANTKTGPEKEKLLSEAALFERNCLVKQIAASEIFGTMSQVRFNSNRETIAKLLTTEKLEASKMTRTRTLVASSEKNMQMAKELREEASSSLSLTTKLGTMSNAEDKEILALGEQSQAIDLLWKKPKSSM